MQHAVQLFIVPRQPSEAAPDPGAPFSVEFDTVDGALAAVTARLEADGYRVRSVNFGPRGIVAYVEERP